MHGRRGTVLRGARRDRRPTEAAPWLDRLSTEGILAHAAVVYGYFPWFPKATTSWCLPRRKRIHPERFRFTFPRQQRDRFLDIADFIRSRELASSSTG